MPAEKQTKIEPQSEADEKLVDLPSEGQSVDVEIKDTEKVVNAEPVEDVKTEDVRPVASQEEVEDYGKKVQSRIDKLTKKLRESERREQAAIQFAQGVQGEVSALKQKSVGVDNAYIDEFGGRVKAETEEAKKALKVALDTGDIDKQVEAQSRLSRLAIENERFEATKAKREQEVKMAKNRPNTPPPGYSPPQMPPPPQPDPKAEDWAEKNEWFGKDEPMTLTSFSIHRKLVEKGIDPTSNEYYTEIDKQMRENFPHKFGNNKTQVSTPSQTVASANRGGPVTARKGTVRLTPSQVAIAKKLGVPLSEYAKYVKE